MGVVRVEFIPKGAAPDTLPPFPVPAGSPPWTMKPGMRRWKGVPSYVPDAANARKLNEHLGAVSQLSSTLRSPSCVWSVTAMLVACAATRAPLCRGRRWLSCTALS